MKKCIICDKEGNFKKHHVVGMGKVVLCPKCFYNCMQRRG